MNREKFITVILAFMAVLLLMGVFGSEKRNASTQIVYVQADPTEAAAENKETSKSSVKSSSSSKSSSKASASKSSSSKSSSSKTASSKETSSKESSSKEISSKNVSSKETNSKKEESKEGNRYYIYVYPETSTIYDDFSDPLETSSEPEPDSSEEWSSDLFDSSLGVSDISSEEISSEENSELSSDLESEPESKFASVERLRQELSEQYAITLEVNTEEQISEDELLSGEGYFKDADKALFELENLKGCLENIGEKELTGLAAQGWEIRIVLTLEIPGQQQLVIADFQQERLQFWISTQNNWISDFYGSVCEGFDFVLSEMGAAEDCYQRFCAQNPGDFEYGKYRPEYLNQYPESTYFVSIAGQLSAENDRSYLYRMFQSGSVKEEYQNQSCPAYRKWQQILEDYREYFVSETTEEEITENTISQILRSLKRIIENRIRE